VTADPTKLSDSASRDTPDTATTAADTSAPSAKPDTSSTAKPDTSSSAKPDASDRKSAEQTGGASEHVVGASRLGRVALVCSAVVLVLALAGAAWFGAGWVRAALTDGPRADARDTALDAARQAAINMTSMNLDDVPGSLALARSSMTGALLDSATKNKDQAEKLAQQSGVAMNSKVLGAALTSLNSEEDKASALVVLQVTENGKDKPAADYRYTWTVDVAKDGDVWKAEQISSLSQPVLLSGGPAAQTSASAGEQPPATPKPGS
jgi:Mce-associated membrane protein